MLDNCNVPRVRRTARIDQGRDIESTACLYLYLARKPNNPVLCYHGECVVSGEVLCRADAVLPAGLPIDMADAALSLLEGQLAGSCAAAAARLRRRLSSSCSVAYSFRISRMSARVPTARQDPLIYMNIDG